MSRRQPTRPANTTVHSPGPWTVDTDRPSPARIVASHEPHQALALVYLTDPTTRRRCPRYAANAQLMARAPALLSLLAEALPYLPGPLSERVTRELDP